MLKMRRVWRRTSSSQADPSPWRHCWTSWASCSNASKPQSCLTNAIFAKPPRFHVAAQAAHAGCILDGCIPACHTMERKVPAKSSPCICRLCQHQASGILPGKLQKTNGKQPLRAPLAFERKVPAEGPKTAQRGSVVYIGIAVFHGECGHVHIPKPAASLRAAGISAPKQCVSRRKSLELSGRVNSSGAMVNPRARHTNRVDKKLPANLCQSHAERLDARARCQ